jgi:hypothetical protein
MRLVGDPLAARTASLVLPRRPETLPLDDKPGARESPRCVPDKPANFLQRQSTLEVNPAGALGCELSASCR